MLIDQPNLDIPYINQLSTASGTILSTNTTMSENSDIKVSSQKAIKTYIDNRMPIGTVLQSVAISTPEGFFFCDGSDKNRETYADLFDVITSDKGEATISIATPAVVTCNGHGMQTGDCIEFTTTGELPIDANIGYYVIYINENTFNIAASYEDAITDAKINTTGQSQSGTHYVRYMPYGATGNDNTFKIPDFRGIFPRGNGSHGTLVDANGDPFSTNLGGYQNDQMQGHKHSIGAGGNHRHSLAATRYNDGSGYFDMVSRGPSSTGYTNYATHDHPASEFNVALESDETNGTPRAGVETRPANIGINFIIKY